MKSQFNKTELSKLNSILFSKKPVKKEGNLSVKPQQQQQIIMQHKENISHNTPLPLSLTTPNLNLHTQMQTLKHQVQTMLSTNHQSSVDKVIRSTTRYYLQKIRSLSTQLPEGLDTFKEAASTFLESLPIRRRGMGTERSTMVMMRYGLKVLFGVMERGVRRRYQEGMGEVGRMGKRRGGKEKERMLEGEARERRRKVLGDCWRGWRGVLEERWVEREGRTVAERVRELITIPGLLMSEESTMMFLQKMLSYNEVHCEIALIRNNKLHIYSQTPTLSLQSSMRESFLLSNQPSPTSLLHTTPINHSLTKICISSRQIILTNTPNSDPDFSSLDYPISPHISSLYPHTKLPLMFVPIVVDDVVVGVVRLFEYPMLDGRGRMGGEMVELVRGTVGGMGRLGRVVEEYREAVREEERRVWEGVVGLVERIEGCEEGEVRGVFQELGRVMECEEMVVMGYSTGGEQIIFSSVKSSTPQTLPHTIPIYSPSNILLGKALFFTPHPPPSLSPLLPKLLALIFSRLSSLALHHLQHQSTLLLLQKQHLLTTKLRIQKIIRLGLSEMTSFNLVNVVKVVNLLVGELGLQMADVFVEGKEEGGGVVSGTKCVRGEDGRVEKGKVEDLKRGVAGIGEGMRGVFGFVEEGVRWDEVNVWSEVVEKKGDRIGLVVSFGVKRGDSKQELVREILKGLKVWLEHLVRISDTKDTMEVSKIIKEFKEDLFNHRQQEDTFLNNQQEVPTNQGNQQILPHPSNSSLFAHQARQLISNFTRICSNVQLHTEQATLHNQTLTVSTTFHSLNHLLQQHISPLFSSSPSIFQNMLIVKINKVCRRRVFEGFEMIIEGLKGKKVGKREDYENRGKIERLDGSLMGLWEEGKRAGIMKMKGRRERWMNGREGSSKLLKVFEGKVLVFARSAFMKIKNRMRPRNPMVISTVCTIHLNTLLSSFAKLKLTPAPPLSLNSTSLITSLTFPQSFSLLKNILLKSKSLTSFDLYLQNTNNSQLISLSPLPTPHLQISSTLPPHHHKLSFHTFNLLWLFPPHHPLPLPYPLKQHLSTISRIISQNILSYQSLIFPIFLNLNSLLQQNIKQHKGRALLRWRGVVGHGNKLKEYGNIERAWRVGNEVMLVGEERERKRGQGVSMEGEYQVMKGKLEGAERVLEYERREIEGINRGLGVYAVGGFVKEREQGKSKRDEAWGKWKLMVLREKINGRMKIDAKKERMLVAGLKEIKVILTLKLNSTKAQALKHIIISLPSLSSQNPFSSRSSLSSQSQSLHIRIPTISSIPKQSSILSTKLIETRFYSLSSSNKLKEKLSSKSCEKRERGEEKENQRDEENYFEPIERLKEKMISGYVERSIDGSTFDGKEEGVGGYRLGERTLKFLKRYGKGKGQLR